MENIGPKWLTRPEKFTTRVSSVLESIGLAALGCIAVVTVVDVIGDKFFTWPVPGSTEIIGLLQLVAIASGLAFSKIDGRQIYVGFLLDTLKGRAKAGLDILCSVLALAFWAIASWMLVNYAVALMHRGTGTFLLGILQYPFVFWIAVACCIPMCLLIILDIARSATRVRKGGEVK